ncbi:MAG: hypothetical protein SWY16_25090 [Cyanobacteriota bacterium]|nr:hypothetical protein [Cyanobacteriota bacterium]
MSQVINPSPPQDFTATPIVGTGGLVIIPSQTASEPLRVNGTAEGDGIFLNLQSEEEFASNLQDSASAVASGLMPPENPAALDAFNTAQAAVGGVAEATPADTPEATANAIAELDSAIDIYQTNGVDASELIGAREQLANSLGGVVDGGEGDDTMIAGRGYDSMLGGPGADVLFGNAGRDTLEAGSGDDFAFGGQGDDVISGGDDNDLVSGDKGNDIVFGGRGNDFVGGGEGDDFAFGGQGEDIVVGNEGNDSVYGDKGNDFVAGGEGADLVFGGEGDDSVLGGQDNDTIDGGAGNDIIYGDKGDDILLGGEGQDTFRFEFFGDNPTPVTADDRLLGIDTLTDFNPAEDVISLDRQIFPALDDTLRAEFTQINNSAELGDQTAAIVYDASAGLVYYNPTAAAGDEVDILRLDPSPDMLDDDNLDSF